jgi:hypothetical protein
LPTPQKKIEVNKSIKPPQLEEKKPEAKKNKEKKETYFEKSQTPELPTKN